MTELGHAIEAAMPLAVIALIIAATTLGLAPAKGERRQSDSRFNLWF